MRRVHQCKRADAPRGVDGEGESAIEVLFRHGGVHPGWRAPVRPGGQRFTAPE
jgi:hypothetical protein